MKPIPTPEELHASWHSGKGDAFDYVHSILAPMIEEARNPWRKIADAPSEHLVQEAIVAGGTKISHISLSLLLNCASDRTHYMLLSDLPPVPQEPKTPQDDGFDAWWKANRIPYCNEEQARTIWQAARKEKP